MTPYPERVFNKIVKEVRKKGVECFIGNGYSERNIFRYLTRHITTVKTKTYNNIVYVTEVGWKYSKNDVSEPVKTVKASFEFVKEKEDGTPGKLSRSFFDDKEQKNLMQLYRACC